MKTIPKIKKELFEIAGIPLKQYSNIIVIAEIASSHEGNKDIALDLLKAAYEAGADFIKFQVFSANELLTPNCQKFKDFQEIELDEREWKEIFQECKAMNYPFIAEIFDDRSFKLVDQHNPAAYKIHSTDLTNPVILEKVALSDKPILLSCGGSTIEEIKYAVDYIELKNNYKIILMHGFQAFPTNLKDTFLNEINTLKQKFLYPIGYADHIDAETKDSITLPIAAIGLGASVIEKHITLNRSLKGRDYYSAMNPDEFAELIIRIKNISISIGEPRNRFTQAEIKYRNLMKKSIVASKNVGKGEIITESDISFKRTPNPGIPPDEYKRVVGYTTKKRIKKNTLINKGDIINL